MRYKLCVFDIDGVLNPTGKSVQKESIEALKKLEEQELRISFASGKHPWHITGGLVFSGLLKEDMAIIGEAGGHVFFPQSKQSVLYSKYIKDVKRLREAFYENQWSGNEFWEEPKETMFSIFPRNQERIHQFADYLQTIIKKENLNLYTIKQVDAIDVMQKGLSKRIGLEVLCKHLNISLNEIIAFGDGMNDLEMLSCVGYPVAVANALEKIKEVVQKRKGHISKLEYGKGVLEAVDYIIENVLQE